MFIYCNHISKKCHNIMRHYENYTAFPMKLIMIKLKENNLHHFNLYCSAFAALVLVGAFFMLMLPISSKEHITTPFNKKLFSHLPPPYALPDLCCDTATYWSAFRSGNNYRIDSDRGLGVITVAASFSPMLSGAEKYL